jgi:tetratricopeptide (TPR) repeat protein
MVRVPRFLPCAALAALPAFADAVSDAAGEAIAAAGDRTVLGRLAQADEPDPWLVADEVCRRGEFDAAIALAGAAPRVRLQGLARYVESARAEPAPEAARKTLEEAAAALAAGDAAAALAAIDRAPESRGLVTIRLHHLKGAALRAAGRLPESISAFRAASEGAERIGWLARAADAAHESAWSAYLCGDLAAARDAWDRALALFRDLEDPTRVAATMQNLGEVHRLLGDPSRALELQDSALDLARRLGNRLLETKSRINLGLVHAVAGRPLEALACQEEAVELARAGGWQALEFLALGNAGEAHRVLGSHGAAREALERAVALGAGLGDPRAQGNVLSSLGLVHFSLGSFADALDILGRALECAESSGDRRAVARIVGNLGEVHRRLGAAERALRCQERSFELATQTGDREAAANALVNLGLAHDSAGETAEAARCQERALAAYRDLGLRAGEAFALGNLGEYHRRLGAFPVALEYHAQALALMEALLDREGAARTLGNMALVHETMGDFPKAGDLRGRALELAREVGAQETVVLNLWGIASVRLGEGAPAESLAASREAVRILGTLVGGLGDLESAAARGRFGGIFEVGIRAAMAARRPDEVFWFLESGRAGALLETLGGREALRESVLPEPLLREEREARAVEAAARHRLRRAASAEDRAEVLRCRKDLDSACARVGDAISRIQREAKRAAALLYPEAAPLDRVRERLREGEVLILYAMLEEDAIALLAWREGARVIRLGPAARIRKSIGDPESLRRLVVDPLGIDEKWRTLLFSPDGALAEVPFAQILPDREVGYVPSGTTLLLLRSEAVPRGEGVLAVGDPDGSLPSSRKEVVAVGDIGLVGEAATVEGIRRGLAGRPRWEALHIACHAVVDTRRPSLSSLLLADGPLSLSDAGRLGVAADLVVLSACETARGPAFRAEGVMGFPRAFMLAGASRVIVSLWKVDDEATAALMIRFHESWRGGAGCAAALREAQRHVAAQEPWRDPKYWAAWQVWGLPE